MKNSFGSLVRALMFRHILTVWHGAKIAFRNTSFLFFLLVINIAPIFVTMAWSQMPKSRALASLIVTIVQTIIYFAYIIAIPTFLKLTFAGMPPSLHMQSTIVGGVIKMIFRAFTTLTILFAIATPVLILSTGIFLGAGNLAAYIMVIGLIGILIVFTTTLLILYHIIRSLLDVSSRGEVQRYILHHLSFFLFIFSMYFIIIFAIYGMQFRMLPSMDTNPEAFAKLPPWYVQLAIKTLWGCVVICVDYIAICSLYVFCTQNPLDTAVIEDAPANTPPAV